MAISLMQAMPPIPQPLPAVTPLAIASIYDSGEDLYAGRGISLWVYLNGPAPSPGALLTVASSDEMIAVPLQPIVLVGAGATWTAAVLRAMRPGTITITIALGLSVRTYRLDVLDPADCPAWRRLPPARSR